MKRLFVLFVVLSLALISSAVSHAITYNWTTLDYPGETGTQPLGISGNYVVGCYSDESGAHGFLYNGTTWTTLDYPGATETCATGISGNNIVGTYGETVQTSHGFLYNGTTWTTLDYPGAVATPSIAGISGNNIVGNYYEGRSDHAFLYNGTTWTALNYPGKTYTQASGVSGNKIVGIYSDESGDHGFLYNGSTWKTLDYPGAIVTMPTGISGNNIVGTAYDETGSYSFLYNGMTWTTLEFPGATETHALGISGNNIIGIYCNDNDCHAFIAKTSSYIKSAISSTASDYYKKGANINITLNFTEPVSSTGLTINLNSGASIATGPFSNKTTWSGIYAVGTGQTASSLNIRSITGKITDAAGFKTTVAVPLGSNIADSKTIVIDTTRPTITISNPSIESTQRGPVTYTVAYKDVNFYLATLYASKITLNATGTANGVISSVIWTGMQRKITISSITGNGTLGISIAAGTAKDKAGNNAPASAPSATFTVEP